MAPRPSSRPLVLLVVAFTLLVGVLFLVPAPWDLGVVYLGLVPAFGAVAAHLVARQAEDLGGRAAEVAATLRRLAAMPPMWLLVAVGLLTALLLGLVDRWDLAGPASVVPLFLLGYGAGLVAWVPAPEGM